MIFHKIKKPFTIETVALALNFQPLLISKPPYEEIYPFWQLFYVNRGHMAIERDGVRHTVNAGELLLRPPGCRSTMYYPETGTLYMGLIDFMTEDDTILALGDTPIPLEEKEREQMEALLTEAAGFFRDPPENPLWQSLISSALENLLIRLYGRRTGIFPASGMQAPKDTRKSRSETVERVDLILEERRFSSITVDELAAILGESPNALMKRYRRETRESIIEHFLDLKLETAKQFIATGEMNFTEIAELLGFSSVGYFSKFFKKRTGMTPSEYAKTGGGE